MKKIAWTILALSVVAACGGAGGNGATTTSLGVTTTTGGAPTTTDVGTTPTDAGSTTTAAPPTTDPPGEPDHELVISGFAFNVPSPVSVGETIEVSNRDSIPHNWTSTDGVFASGPLSGETTYLYTFEEAGTFSFLCTIHPEMTGSITVGG